MNVKVVLTEDVPKVGKKGEIKEVSRGYAENFLVARKKAVFATPQAIEAAQATARRAAEKRATAEAEGRKILAEAAGKRVIVNAKGKGGKLFGSVGKKEILAALMTAGCAVQSEWIVLSHPLKEAGEHAVKLALPNGASTTVTVVVVAG